MTGLELINLVLLELNQDGLGKALGLGDGAETSAYTTTPANAVLGWLNEGQEKLNESIWPVQGVASASINFATSEVCRWEELTAAGDHGDLFSASNVFWDGTELSFGSQDLLPFYRERLGQTGTPIYAVVLKEGVTLVPLPAATDTLLVRGRAYGQAITSGAEVPDMSEGMQSALKVWAKVRASEKLLNEGYGDYYKAAMAEWNTLTGGA